MVNKIQPKRVFVIGDESSGKDLIAELNLRGATLDVYRPTCPFLIEDPGQLPKVPHDLAERCAEFQPDFIVPSAEHWVTLADVAAAQFTEHANNIQLAYARRNKAAMIKELHRRGIRHPFTVEVCSTGQLGTGLARMSYPVVVKPSSSGGSDMCSICTDSVTAEKAVAQVLGATNLLGEPNLAATVQEYVEGPQLFVNTVSIDGRHTVTEVFKYAIDEVGGVPTIHAAYTLRETDPDALAAVEYVLPCLDALGFRFGASHTEVRITSNGPQFIEFNGRMMGPCIPSNIYRSVRGHSQATELARMLNTGTTSRDGGGIGWGGDVIGWYMLSAVQPGRLIEFDYSAALDLPEVLSVERAPTRGTVVELDNRVTTGAMGMVFFTARGQEHADTVVSTIQDLEQTRRLFTMAAH
ncbi:ATP-grasp domain-containing protein [Rhodococcus sp. NPDC058521]|uniref:ATP-grasp domain-containing protein n=1 Tax=Rhodococcus sp. NPDC058521 TaxID=3346536 RepID=UPI00364A0889